MESHAAHWVRLRHVGMCGPGPLISPTLCLAIGGVSIRRELVEAGTGLFVTDYCWWLSRLLLLSNRLREGGVMHTLNAEAIDHSQRRSRHLVYETSGAGLSIEDLSVC